MPADVAAALAAAARLGPFCAVDDDAGPCGVDLADAPGLLAARTRAVVAVLGPDAEPRVVRSLVHLGVVARVLSPAIGAALATGVLPVPTSVRLQPAGSNPVPMAWAGVRGVAVPTPDDVAGALAEHWLASLVQPFTDVVAASGVSRQVLTGNVVSAVHGTGVVVAAARPDLAAGARALVDALVAAGPLAGTGARRPDGSFVRRSCCLVQRLPGAGTCADCVLVRPAAPLPA
ncbi:FhuF 2Fe-2S C-terminal domain-containing protein [Klenkia soli]|uniref:FhuF 2Fe-2S C-terminal domain-containing protein n=1 Tax=Klenkia soli TaxID=1052260 RepID=A0A1H0U0H3_9ACTN|nr:(2Fe-2S)-binding protein [Klenkia soli]SDP59525.1 FhuF 2Fe-2S C-terminal domain-containing protein [Klenkia soli]